MSVVDNSKDLVSIGAKNYEEPLVDKTNSININHQKKLKLKLRDVQEALKNAPQPRSLQRYKKVGKIVFDSVETKKVIKMPTSPQVAKIDRFTYIKNLKERIYKEQKERWAARESSRLVYKQEILEEDEIVDLEEDLALTDSDAEEEDENVKKEDDETHEEMEEEKEEEEAAEAEDEDEDEENENPKRKKIEDSEDEAIDIRETKKTKKDSKKRKPVRVDDSDEEGEESLPMKLLAEEDYSNHSNTTQPSESIESEESEEENEENEEILSSKKLSKKFKPSQSMENKENIDDNDEEDEEEKEVRPSDFFFNEAELSGEGSSDEEEDEDGEDELIKELIDEEADKLDGEKIRNDVAKVFHKELENEDKRMLLQLQERYLEDGDLHSDHKRIKKFRWATASPTWLDNARDSDSSTDEEGGEDDNDDDDDTKAPVFRLKNPYLPSTSENKVALSSSSNSNLPQTTLTKPSGLITSYLVRDARLNDVLSTKRRNPADRNQGFKRLKPDSTYPFNKTLFYLLSNKFS